MKRRERELEGEARSKPRMAAKRWIRLDVGWANSEWLVGLRPGGRLAWIELLTYVKLHGTAGRAKAMTAVAAGIRWKIDRKDVSAMIQAAVGDGALAILEGDWVVTKWGLYQEPDRTSAERKRRQRQRDVTGGHGSHGVTSVTGGVTRRATVTVTETDASSSPDASSAQDISRIRGTLLVAAVAKFCDGVGVAWRLAAPLEKWAADLAGQYPGIDIPRELRKATEWWQGEGRRRPKSPDRAIRNWLEKSLERAARNGGPEATTPAAEPSLEELWEAVMQQCPEFEGGLPPDWTHIEISRSRLREWDKLCRQRGKKTRAEMRAG